MESTLGPIPVGSARGAGPQPKYPSTLAPRTVSSESVGPYWSTSQSHGLTAGKPRLSIVVPAYNEERRLPASMERLDRYVRRLDRPVEVIVVDNGSADGTSSVVRRLQERMPYLRLLHEGRRGKGCAVRGGVLAATGDHVMFCDADFSMPPEGIDHFLALLDAGAPIVIGSRELRGSRRHGEPTTRHIMGRVYNRVVQALVVAGIDDTQCGFKAFQRPVARDLFELQRIQGWSFDAEILYLARWRGYTVRQAPVDWYYDGDSRVHGLLDSFGMFGETLRIRVYAGLGLYRRARSLTLGPTVEAATLSGYRWSSGAAQEWLDALVPAYHSYAKQQDNTPHSETHR